MYMYLHKMCVHSHTHTYIHGQDIRRQGPGSVYGEAGLGLVWKRLGSTAEGRMNPRFTGKGNGVERETEGVEREEVGRAKREKKEEGEE